MERAFARNAGLPDPGLPVVTDPNSPMPRLEVVSHFARLLGIYRSRIRMAPRPFPTDLPVLSALPEKYKGDAEKLVKWGLLAPVGPILTGPSDSLTAAQAGDALGLFFFQIGNLTHKADPKWTPTINPEEGG